MSERLVLLATAVLATSGVPGLFMGRRSAAGQWIGTLLFAGGAVTGICGVVHFWITGQSVPVVWPWSIPGGEFRVAMDGISAFFLVPIFLIPMLGTLYGVGYWKQAEHPENGQKLRLFYGLVTASLALIVIAANAIVFLVAWEVMALAAFFLVTTEDQDAGVREVGLVYLVATHIATLLLIAMFALLRSVSGSFLLGGLAEGQVPNGMANGIFMLAVAGFGLKAGVMPLHVWLPGAHAMAPSHVSALLSGVLIKIGIYGMVRVVSLFPNPPAWWGGSLLALGTISGVLGVAFAIGQHDLKRLLAYHSVENIGIIVMGVGLGLLGRTFQQPEWLALGLAGGLLHVWNHGLFKSLLFLCAGSVLHAAHTREIDHLGGLAKAMPRTALCFAVGAVAICGLPPLNGFISELFIYLGLFRTLGLGGNPSNSAVIAAPFLAVIGALALACFVKAYGAVFLGEPRSEHARHVHESPASMTGPMFLLVSCCFTIGLVPVVVAPVLEGAIASFTSEPAAANLRLVELSPLVPLSVIGLGLLVVILVCGMVLTRQRTSENQSVLTWDCGYAAPSPTMQYTSSSFAQMLVALFGWVLRPKTHVQRPDDLFARKGEFHSQVDDTVLDGAILPTFRGGTTLFGWLRVLQQGSIQLYLLYIFVTLVVLLSWQWL
ncbi:MAG: hydrogenase [Planctomycetes bacterium]|nr:hydrogenase [Planctomycetota bacterium]